MLKCSPATLECLPSSTLLSIAITLFLKLWSSCLVYIAHNSALMYLQEPWVSIQKKSSAKAKNQRGCATVTRRWAFTSSAYQAKRCPTWTCVWWRKDVLRQTLSCLKAQLAVLSVSRLTPAAPATATEPGLMIVCLTAMFLSVWPVAAHVLYHQKEHGNATFITDHSGMCFENYHQIHKIGCPFTLKKKKILSLCEHGLSEVCFRFVTKMKKPQFSP